MSILRRSMVQGHAVVIALYQMVLEGKKISLSFSFLPSALQAGTACNRFVARLTLRKCCKHRKVGGLPVFHLQTKATYISWNTQLSGEA